MALCLRHAADGSPLQVALSDPVYQDVYTTAWQHLLTGVDHLEALVSALHGDADSARVPQAACFTLARGCLESASYACWLLEHDLSEAIRLARGLAARAHNMREEHKLSIEVARNRERAGIEARRQAKTASLEMAARDRGLSVCHDGHWPVRFGTESRPGATVITARWLKALYPHEKHPTYVYRLMSGYAHGLGYALALNAIGEQRVGQLTLVQVEPPLGTIVPCVIASAELHHHAVTLLGVHSGRHDVPSSVTSTR